MKTLELKQVSHGLKIGQKPKQLEPNVYEDTLFVLNGEPVGFYIANVKGDLKNFLGIANKEFVSERVPKVVMRRSSGVTGKNLIEVEQYSTILGGIPSKPHFKREYKTMSSVHAHKTAKLFVKAMLKACHESEKLIESVCPAIHARQKKIIEEGVPEKWRFGNLFTSSISNSNASAPMHIDRANIKETVNVIMNKRRNARGGNLHVPDFGLTLDSKDNSIIVYPAWRNLHGVTEIIARGQDAYRNSLIFYPIKDFIEKKEAESDKPL